MRRRLVTTTTAITASALLAAGISACGSDGDSGGGDDTLTYWASNQAASLSEDRKILRAELDKFEKKTGKKVELEVIAWPDLYKRILTATSSGQGPDVLNIGNTWSASLQATGAFTEFDEAKLDAIGGQDKFVSTSFGATGAEGETPTSVPLYGLAYGLFYNKKLLAEEGITKAPATWEDFLAAAKKLTKDTNSDGKPDQWGLVLEAASVTENAHWAFMLGRQQGGELFTDGKASFDSPQQVAAVKQYVDLMSEHGVVAPSNAEYRTGTQALTDFAKGKAAMVLWQNNAQSTLSSLGMKPDAYEVAPLPVPGSMPPGGEPVQSHVAGINLSVFSETDDEKGALDLVKFLTSTQQQEVLNEKFGSLPVVTDAYQAPAFANERTQTFKTILAEHSEPMPEIPAEGEMETIVGNELTQLFAKAATGSVSEADVKAAMKRASDQMAASGN